MPLRYLHAYGIRLKVPQDTSEQDGLGVSRCAPHQHVERLRPSLRLHRIDLSRDPAMHIPRNAATGVVMVEPAQGLGFRPICGDNTWNDGAAQIMCAGLGFANGTAGGAHVPLREMANEPEVTGAPPVYVHCSSHPEEPGKSAAEQLAECGFFPYKTKPCTHVAVAVCSGLSRDLRQAILCDIML